MYGKSCGEYCGETLRNNIVVFIRECQSMGYSPTQREIGEKVKRAPSTVNKHLQRLAKNGVLRVRGVNRIEFL